MKSDITKLVETGDKVEINYESKSGEKVLLVSNVLGVTNENKFSIAMPIYKAKIYSISRGERVHVRYCKQDAGIYEFNALVVKLTNDDGIVGLELLRISDMQKSQRREYYRLSVIKDIELFEKQDESEIKYVDEAKQIIDDSDVVSYKGVLKDISGGGMRVLTRIPLELGLNIISSFALDKKIINVKGVIVRSIVFDPVVHQFDIGIEFHELEEQSRAEIVSFIFQRQRNIIRKGMG